jgi:sigma-E factor negative regulatory protein RseA
MKKNNNEHLSALIDGENYDDKDVLEKLIIDDSMKSTWQRYHLIGDCLRGNLPEKIHNNYLKDLNKLLHNEPALLSPKKNKLFGREPLIGFAIAASVATLAVLNIQHRNNMSSKTTTESVVMDEKIIDSQFDTFSFPEAPISTAAVQEDAEFDLLSKQRLNNYLINHSRSRHNIKMNTILPYARIVTIDLKE